MLEGRSGLDWISMTNVDSNPNFRAAVGCAVAVPAFAAFVYWLSWKSYQFLPLQVRGACRFYTVLAYIDGFLICMLCSISTCLGRLLAGFLSGSNNILKGDEVRAPGSLVAP